jgi:hypothetical protein
MSARLSVLIGGLGAALFFALYYNGTGFLTAVGSLFALSTTAFLLCRSAKLLTREKERKGEKQGK